MQKDVGNPSFPASVLFTDGASFSLEEVLKTHNAHVCAYYNPHGTRNHAVQHCLAVNVCPGIINDCLLRSYLLPPQMDSRIYLIFLETVLPVFLHAAPAHIRQDMWFQNDGAQAYSKIIMHDYLNQEFAA
ncbi:uncharacterized protein TNCT_442731 [Trichonephila clavata]|uniref:Uncharacterized protein n=1 Tax=Trichonephila clavata TaxID=2740835 RepID=A0A8X6GGM9_TRICU|nr:uncharacterized protein TNCT_442731 [Trichonephila clavata]